MAEQLAGLIRSGAFDARGRIPSERALMQRFAVGRSTIREAVFAVRKLGLVKVSAGAPARIAEPTPPLIIHELSGLAKLLAAEEAGMRAFQKARALFEIGIVREVSRTLSPEAEGAIAAALAANRASVTRRTTFAKTDIAFHRSLVAATGNPLFLALHDAFALWLADQRTTSAAAGADPEVVYREHERIFEAVRAGEAGDAQQAMQDHLDGVVRHYWSTVGPRARTTASPE